MAISVFDLFKVGVGPSSSHTVGPMVAARSFVTAFADERLLADVVSVRVELFGSLGATGHGHGSVPAVVLGLMGREPGTVDTEQTPVVMSELEQSHRLALLDDRFVDFDPAEDIVLHRSNNPPTWVSSCWAATVLCRAPREASSNCSDVNDVPIRGAQFCVIGCGTTVGRPLGLMLTRLRRSCPTRSS